MKNFVVNQNSDIIYESPCMSYKIYESLILCRKKFPFSKKNSLVTVKCNNIGKLVA